MGKFKVGDKVRIKEDTKDTIKLLWLEEMNKYRGLVTYIRDVGFDRCYYLEEGSIDGADKYQYDEVWLELVEENEFEIEEKEIENLFN